MAQRIEVIGHGGSGHFFPLNSRQAIQHAIDLGVDRIEVDVQKTSDGQAVLVHDRRLLHQNTLTRVTDLDHAAVKSVVPDLLTLDQLLEANTQRKPLMLDIKEDGLESIIAESVRRHNATSYVSACSISPRAIKTLHEQLPDMELALTWGGQAKYFPIKSANRLTYPLFGLTTVGPFVATARLVGAREATINFRMLNSVLVKWLQASGLYVIAWTIDTPDEIRLALFRGVNAITSNRPDLVIAIMRDEGFQRLDH